MVESAGNTPSNLSAEPVDEKKRALHAANVRDTQRYIVSSRKAMICIPIESTLHSQKAVFRIDEKTDLVIICVCKFSLGVEKTQHSV